MVLQVLGWLVFLASTIMLGTWLRRNPNKRNAERTSRILHFLFWVGTAPPMGLGVFYPGLLDFDTVLGLSPLTRHSLWLITGTSMGLIGTYLIIVSNLAVRFSGKGAAAFLLTKRLVTGSVYNRTRNPMSLGLYLGSVGVSLLVGSRYLMLVTLLVVIPVHIFYLKYFEEYELELRLGPAYLEYKEKVPFLFPRWISGKM